MVAMFLMARKTKFSSCSGPDVRFRSLGLKDLINRIWGCRV